MIFKNFSTLFIGILLTGCTLPTQSEKPPQYTDVSYQCDQGTDLMVRYDQANASATVRYLQNEYELTQSATASGFLYSNSKVSIRGKGEEVRLEIGRMAPTLCHAK